MSQRPTSDIDETPADRPLYPAARAFIVEIHRDAEITRVTCAGRVEHISSGQVVRFADVETLLRFLSEGCIGELAARAPPGASQQESAAAPAAVSGGDTKP